MVVVLKNVLVISDRVDVIRVGVRERSIAVEVMWTRDMSGTPEQIEGGVKFAYVDSGPG